VIFIRAELVGNRGSSAIVIGLTLAFGLVFIAPAIWRGLRSNRPDGGHTFRSRSSARGREACLESKKGKLRHARVKARRIFAHGESTFHR
jgi:hypothetical protein